MKRIYMVTKNLLLTLAALAMLTSFCCGTVTVPVPITIGRSVVDLNSPWKFNTGDNPAWADPNFDDSTWESVDLTAPPGAHDEDVGLTGYVPGWGARGHRGYSGYAWYRLRVSVTAPNEDMLAIAGPPAADSAYQVFVNGQLLGGLGRFSGLTPTVFSIQPRMFTVARSLLRDEHTNGTLIALRVWMGPWDLADPSAGGIRIAPSLGEASSIDMLYQVQWVQTVKGYVVEVVEAIAFLLLAMMARTVAAFDCSKRAYFWLCAALVITALVRANQAIFYWGQFETVHALELISAVLLPPLGMAAWTMAWHAWFGQSEGQWMTIAVGVLALLYVGAEFLSASWFYGVAPLWLVTTAGHVITWTRIVFALLMGIIICQAVRRREAGVALAALGLVSVGQFARELSALGVRGIWFPYGAGVSRTQFAYAAFDAVLFLLLVRRFLFFARSRRTASMDAISKHTTT